MLSTVSSLSISPFINKIFWIYLRELSCAFFLAASILVESSFAVEISLSLFLMNLLSSTFSYHRWSVIEKLEISHLCQCHRSLVQLTHLSFYVFSHKHGPNTDYCWGDKTTASSAYDLWRNGDETYNWWHDVFTTTSILLLFGVLFKFYERDFLRLTFQNVSSSVLIFSRGMASFFPA